jgi:hypothetical protein
MNTDAEQTASKPAEIETAAPSNTGGQNVNWRKSVAFWISAISLICSLGSLVCSLGSCINTNRSANAANRSADAAATSAAAALTNADWVNFQRNPHHDVIAKVLKFRPVMAGYSSEDTNGLAYIDLALINNGNQSEIIRRVNFYYYDKEDANGGITESHAINSQLPKGDKQVLHLVLDRGSTFTGKTVWLYIGVTAIGPDAEDIESKWLVTSFTLATNGNGGQWSDNPQKSIQVISNERLPSQRKEVMPFY